MKYYLRNIESSKVFSRIVELILFLLCLVCRNVRIISLRQHVFLLCILPFSSLFLISQSSSAQVAGTKFLKETNLIFVGELVEKESHWSDDQRFILTRHIFKVEDTIKGIPGQMVEIIEYGGTVGGITQEVTHVARYEVNRPYLIFSYRDDLQRNRTMGGVLGQFRVIEGSPNQRIVRIYSSHPLTSILGGQSSSIFWDLDNFSATLEEKLVVEEW